MTDRARLGPDPGHPPIDNKKLDELTQVYIVWREKNGQRALENVLIDGEEAEIVARGLNSAQSWHRFYVTPHLVEPQHRKNTVPMSDTTSKTAQRLALENVAPEQSKPIIPTQRDVDAWRLSAEQAVRFGGVKLGEFNWPQAVLSLAAEWEKKVDELFRTTGPAAAAEDQNSPV